MNDMEPAFGRPRLPAIQKTKVANCYISLTLDIRDEQRSPDGIVHACIRFNIDRSRFYVRLPEKFTRQDYIKMVSATGRGRKKNGKESLFEIRLRLEKEYNRYLRHLEELSHIKTLTIPLIKIMATGLGGELSFLSIWEEEARKRSLGTRLNYLAARNSFIRYVGNVQGFALTVEDIRLWEKKMYEDGMSSTTVGIYERACRVIWKTCQKSGYISSYNYPFGTGIGGDKVVIPRGANRKRSWLNVKQMNELYQIFVGRRYPSNWGQSHQTKMENSLGLFLAQYLCNGFNLADAAYLTYDEDYFKCGGRSLRFIRKKTKERSNWDNEVIIPIIPQLKVILERIGGEVKPGRRVFPAILKNSKNEAEQHRLIIQENQNIRKRLGRLTATLGWECRPTSTWARHSFATNLTHAGVPLRYISQSMGHSVDNDVTARYIDNYPLEQQMYYNSLLLKDKEIEDMIRLHHLLKEATPEQLKDVIKILL